jgi:hypothetical protein
MQVVIELLVFALLTVKFVLQAIQALVYTFQITYLRQILAGLLIQV